MTEKSNQSLGKRGFNLPHVFDRSVIILCILLNKLGKPDNIIDFKITYFKILLSKTFPLYETKPFFIGEEQFFS